MESIRKYRVAEESFSEPHYITDKGINLFESDYGEFPFRKEMKFDYQDIKLIVLFRNEDDASYLLETINKIEKTYYDTFPLVLENYLPKGEMLPKNLTVTTRYKLVTLDVCLDGSIIQNSSREIYFCLEGNILNPIIAIQEVNYFYHFIILKTSFAVDTLFNEGKYIGPSHLGFGLILDGEDDNRLLSIKSLNGLVTTSNRLDLLNLPNLESIDDLIGASTLTLKNTPKLKNLKSYEGCVDNNDWHKIILSVGSSPCMDYYKGHVYFDKSSRPDSLFIFNEEEDLSDMPVEEYHWRKYVAANLDISSFILIMSNKKLSSFLFDFEKEIINRRIKGEEVITTLTIQNN